jgi:hypothetical protein
MESNPRPRADYTPEELKGCSVPIVEVKMIS